MARNKRNLLLKRRLLPSALFAHGSTALRPSRCRAANRNDSFQNYPLQKIHRYTLALWNLGKVHGLIPQRWSLLKVSQA
jgi:hypothetical protein